MFVGYVGFSVAHANSPGSGPTPIDVLVLDNKRLFFSEGQRQAGNAGYKPIKQSTKSVDINHSARSTEATELISDEVLHYTGVVHSARGVQLLLNGYPWKPGQLEIVSARLDPQTQQIEIETSLGVLHRLLPGETVEVKP